MPALPIQSRSVVHWAKQNLGQPVRIKLSASQPARTLVHVLLFSVPFAIVVAMAFLKLSGFHKASWWGIFLLGVVLSIPAGVIAWFGARTRQTLVESLDADGATATRGQRFLWENLRCVDHVSKVMREGGVTRRIEDNQLELVFSNGKAIIPPLIEERERIWALINSAPAEVRIDGQVTASAPAG